MSSLVTAFKDGLRFLRRKDDDSFDRFTNRYTIAFFLTCSLFLGTKTYVGETIKCFTPAEFKANDNWIKYTENLCFIENTYHVPINKNIPLTAHMTRAERLEVKPELTYYQWVPIILIFMVFILSVPVFFWRMAMKMSGYDIQSIVTVANSIDNLNPEKLDSTCSYLVAQLDRHITYHRNQKRGFIPLGNGYGRFLYFMYLVTKCLYIAVPVFLIYLLTTMTGEGFQDYGMRALRGLVDDDELLTENPMFPKITYCDFKVRVLGGHVNQYTVQCVLPINLFNELVFFVIWWWLYVLTAISVLGLLVLLLRTSLPNSSTHYIAKFLLSRGDISTANSKEVRHVAEFSNEYLAVDGVLMVRILSWNLPDVVTAQIVGELFKKWRKNECSKRSTDGSMENLRENSL